MKNTLFIFGDDDTKRGKTTTKKEYHKGNRESKKGERILVSKNKGVTDVWLVADTILLDIDTGCCLATVDVIDKSDVRVYVTVGNETVFTGRFKVYGENDCSSMNNQLSKFGLRCNWLV